MRILILEDEPMIAIDLEDIVHSQVEAEVVHATTLTDALARIEDGIDFALLDIRLGDRGENSLPAAEVLARKKVPFGFVSSGIDLLPLQFRSIPRIAKPYRERDIAHMIPVAA